MAQNNETTHSSKTRPIRKGTGIHGASFTRTDTKDHTTGRTTEDDGTRPDFIKWMEQLKKKVKTQELKERMEAKQYGNR